MVLENMVLGRIYEPEREDLTYGSPDSNSVANTGMIKSRKSLAGHIACMREKNNIYYGE
jgi:hypothetical protein